MIKNLIKHILGIIKCKVNHVEHEGACYIGRHVKIVAKGKIILGKNVSIRPFGKMYTHKKESILEISSDSDIGEMSTISAYNNIYIGRGVLTGPHVFIADHNHAYENPNVPVYLQGVKVNPSDRVMIGDGTWIGTNAVIVGNVRIGRNCVIGANSVVTKDIPDYCVAAGIPCKVIKQYNSNTSRWERV